MNLKLYLFAFCGIIVLNAFSQSNNSSVIASAGGISNSKTLTLEWTLGEPIIESATSSSQLYTQGFHQSTLQVQRLDDKRALAMKSFFHVFPNPASSVVNIKIDSIPATPLMVSLTDASGRVIIKNNFPFQSTVLQLNVSSYSYGTYFLLITNMNGTIKGEYKIIKAK